MDLSDMHSNRWTFFVVTWLFKFFPMFMNGSIDDQQICDVLSSSCGKSQVPGWSLANVLWNYTKFYEIFLELKIFIYNFIKLDKIIWNVIKLNENCVKFHQTCLRRLLFGKEINYLFWSKNKIDEILSFDGNFNTFMKFVPNSQLADIFTPKFQIGGFKQHHLRSMSF